MFPWTLSKLLTSTSPLPSPRPSVITSLPPLLPPPSLLRDLRPALLSLSLPERVVSPTVALMSLPSTLSSGTLYWINACFYTLLIHSTESLPPKESSPGSQMPKPTLVSPWLLPETSDPSSPSTPSPKLSLELAVSPSILLVCIIIICNLEMAILIIMLFRHQERWIRNCCHPQGHHWAQWKVFASFIVFS